MDEASWIDLYREELTPLYRRVSRRVGADRALAEDVTQETWLRALDAWQRDGVPKAPGAWLATVADNLVRSHFRRQGARPTQDTDALGEAAAAEPSPTGPTRAAAVHAGLARLRPDLASIVAERHFDGLTLAEIGARRGLTERAVEGRLRRARRTLARHLDPDALDALS